MSASYSWLAFANRDHDSVLQALGLAKADQSGPHAVWPLSGVQHDGRWYVAVSHDPDYFETLDLAELSQEGLIVQCEVDDQAGYSAASAWNEGEEIWAIVHDAGQEAGRNDLASSGQLPDSFEEVCEKLLAQQAMCDTDEQPVDCVLEIPLEVARLVTGFALFEDHLADLRYQFHQLKLAKRWWQFWKG